MSGGIAPECLFVASSIDVAVLYGNEIEQIAVHPDARILLEGTVEFARVVKRRRGELIRRLRPGETLSSAATAAVQSARAAGYDAVEFTSMKDMGIAIINPAAFVRNYKGASHGSGKCRVVVHEACAQSREELLDVLPVQWLETEMRLGPNR